MNKDNLIEFAKEQCEIFPKDSAMGWYLRKTIKILQAEQCEDAISRQAVLEVVENSCLDLGEYEDTEAFCYTIKSLPSVKPVARIAKVNFSKEDMQEIVDKKVAEITVEPRWIPVSERLPKENTSYLVRVKQGHIMTAIWCGNPEYWRNVIAWMPLPEPYNGSEDKR